MRTEIAIPFAFDTTPIEKKMQEHGLDEAMRILREIVERDAIGAIPRQRDYMGREREGGKPDWKAYMDDILLKWLEDHSTEVIDEAAMLLASKAGRKLKWRDVLRELKEE